MRPILFAFVFAVAVQGGCSGAKPPQGPAQHDAPPPASPSAVRAVPFATGLQHPWGLVFLPDGRMLVTERPGRVRYVSAIGALSAPLQGAPEVVAQSQGGLLDIALAPDFASSKLIYLSYFAKLPGGEGIVVARAKLTETALENLQVIFRARPAKNGELNLGARLLFGPDGKLYVTIGDRFSPREVAQDLGSDLGKTLRLNPDGSIPPDNPFVNKPGALPEIYNLGHRNQQAMAIKPGTNEIWTIEHGPRGGDEVNIEGPGKNYGWPVITYGIDYSGLPISNKAAAPGMEQPLYYWNPSIAPSGMAFYTGDKFPNWKGDLFVGALAGQALHRLHWENGKIANEEVLFRESVGERIRDVRQGPDGHLYLLTDEDKGRILRVEAAR